MKAHLTERSVKGLQPKQKNIIVYDEEVVGFGVRITSGGTRAFILTYRIEARERRLTIGAWPDWSVTAAREEAKRLKREIDQGRDPMAERDEARESPNVRQLIDRYLEEHAAKLAKRNRDDQASMLRKLVEPAWGPRKAAKRSSPMTSIGFCAKSLVARQGNEAAKPRRCGPTASAKSCARCSTLRSAGASALIIPPQASPGMLKRPGIAISQPRKSGGCPLR